MWQYLIKMLGQFYCALAEKSALNTGIAHSPKKKKKWNHPKFPDQAFLLCKVMQVSNRIVTVLPSQLWAIPGHWWQHVSAGIGLFIYLTIVAFFL